MRTVELSKSVGKAYQHFAVACRLAILASVEMSSRFHASLSTLITKRIKSNISIDTSTLLVLAAAMHGFKLSETVDALDTSCGRLAHD